MIGNPLSGVQLVSTATQTDFGAIHNLTLDKRRPGQPFEPQLEIAPNASVTNANNIPTIQVRVQLPGMVPQQQEFNRFVSKYAVLPQPQIG